MHGQRPDEPDAWNKQASRPCQWGLTARQSAEDMQKITHNDPLRRYAPPAAGAQRHPSELLAPESPASAAVANSAARARIGPDADDLRFTKPVFPDRRHPYRSMSALRGKKGRSPEACRP